MQSRDATRSLAGGKAVSEGGVAVISSLRQQVHGLERALREREAAVSELKQNQTASRLREAQLHADTYYRELCRSGLHGEHKPSTMPSVFYMIYMLAG